MQKVYRRILSAAMILSGWFKKIGWLNGMKSVTPFRSVTNAGQSRHESN
jgi:hypothetical protein